MNLLLKIFIKLVNTKILFLSNQSLILGISGGQDSLILLILISIIKNQWSLYTYSTYCNHFWQTDSFISSFHLLRIHYLLRIKIVINVPCSFLKTEEKSREWRYFQFERIQNFYKINTIITGHSKSDKNETFLFNIFRGSGVSNLSSISWKKTRFLNKFVCFGINFKSAYKIYLNKPKNTRFLLIRPLLFLYRYEICCFTKFYNYPVIIDKTNFKVEYFRNRIRYQLLPLLRFYFNPKIDRTLTRFIEIFLTEFEYINLLTLKILKKIQLKNCTNQSFCINLTLFLFLPYSLKKRVLISILKLLKITNIRFDLLEKILKIIFLISKKNNYNTLTIFMLSRNIVLIFYQNQFLIENRKIVFGFDGI
uniref:tRNA(Ile)-lysidine synthase n=1 Tax=Scherffelia dubia TaxID=3190 RepID=A0A142BYA7_SCHDU|nr:tRNA-Ile lysidine synthase [Scherffelia dubia]AMP43399.1 tRNA-Ile lysidine synthase [Scherffelia dubia]